MIVDDFKDESGLWVRSYTSCDGNRVTTRAEAKYATMKQRCNENGLHQKQFQSYVGCNSGFIDFQDFAEWCQRQIGYFENGFQLDKDLLVKGNKVYNKNTAVFIPREVNMVIVTSRLTRGAYPLGVSKQKKKFQVNVRLYNRNKYLGTYDTPEEAFNAYKVAKEQHIKELANKWHDKIDPRAYEALMNYQVEITD